MNISFTEHQQRPYKDSIAKAGIQLWDLKTPDKSDKETYLGISCCDYPNQIVRANYYIGLAWLKEGKHSISVTPKLNIDYLRMFMECFYMEDEDIQNQFMHIYSVDFNKPFIHLETSPFELTPFIIIHYLQLVMRIIRKGLKKDYLSIQANLSGKIKGKIVLSKQFKKNIIGNRTDRHVCQFQEYTEDCIENQILKKALKFSLCFLTNYNVSCTEELLPKLRQALSCFAHVSEINNIPQIKRFHVNPIYKEYVRAIKIARLILNRFSYDIGTVKETGDNSLPPFWIDMPLLFELYTLSLLRKKFGNSVSYHLATLKNEIDFGKKDEQLIIDAKYAPSWEEQVNPKYLGQLSRYARNKEIRKKLLEQEDETSIIHCLLLYPQETGIKAFQANRILEEEKVVELKQYIRFYKLGIQLPLK